MLELALHTGLNEADNATRPHVYRWGSAKFHGRMWPRQQNCSIIKHALCDQIDRYPPGPTIAKLRSGPPHNLQGVTRVGALAGRTYSPRPMLGSLYDRKVLLWPNVSHFSGADRPLQAQLNLPTDASAVNNVGCGDPSSAAHMECSANFIAQHRIRWTLEDRRSCFLDCIHAKGDDQFADQHSDATKNGGNRRRDRDPRGQVSHSGESRDDAGENHDQSSPGVLGSPERWREPRAHQAAGQTRGNVTRPSSSAAATLAGPTVTHSGEVRVSTSEYKVKPIKAEVRRRLGYPHPARVPAGVVAQMAIGISLDEIGRARDADVAYMRNVFPLLDLGWRREDCLAYLTAHGVVDTLQNSVLAAHASSYVNGIELGARR